MSSRNIVPPPKTGGIEQPAFYLIKELVKRGHKIVLFAAPGSKIKGAKVEKISPFSTIAKLERGQLEERVNNFYDTVALADFFSSGRQKNFDLIQFNDHVFYKILPFAGQSEIPIVIQINYPHKEIFPYLKKSISGIKNVHYLPMSDFIKSAMPGLNYLEPFYPSFDFKDFPLSFSKKEHLLFIGRICPEKGVHLAIEAAKRAGRKLIIAGGISPSNLSYFNDLIKPHIDNKNIVYSGEVDFKTKIKLFQKAAATLFPIQWDEPFGLVLVESMACGAPVIAFDRAAVREVVEDKVSGYIVPDGDIEAMARAIKKIGNINRRGVRRYAENNFSINDWVKKYEDIIRPLVLKNKKRR
ncbi:MAG: glycosyltransferase [Candidatus Portnoybacteria bacterium]|nr:glycosyltransferase [Candidatus Portnoybacteria bacterium]MDD4982848.1 glycosyltransferase [Candidatus Portnoybacteria bacterium]